LLVSPPAGSGNRSGFGRNLLELLGVLLAAVHAWALGNPAEGIMFGGKIGLPELLLLLAVALLIFGPSKLADLGKGLGEGIKNFKSAVKDGEQNSEDKKS